MDDKAGHIARADHELACFLRHSKDLPDEAQGWRVTIAFYAALHVVEAYFHHKRDSGKGDFLPAKFSTHNQRTDAINRCPEIRDNVRRAYRNLRETSEQHRYDPGFRVESRMIVAAEASLNTVRSFFLPLL